MGCKLAENVPLSQLRKDLGLPDQCHSFRPTCIKGKAQRVGVGALGAPGAAIGYCQALFAYSGDPAAHSSKVVGALQEAGAPWARSHELFWGNRRSESAAQFVEDGIRPLLSSGRVPILITGLDPAQDRCIVNSIFSTRPAVYDGETILVRLVLKGRNSISCAVKLLNDLVRQSSAKHKMPPWWPLFQGNLSLRDWKFFQACAGSHWRYVNIALNPFDGRESVDTFGSQVTVAQIPIGLACGMDKDGTIKLAEGMKISGAPNAAEWNIFGFADFLRLLPEVPTLIVLGPALPSWSEADNRERVAALIPLLRQSCDIVWAGIPRLRRDMVWDLEA